MTVGCKAGRKFVSLFVFYLFERFRILSFNAQINGLNDRTEMMENELHIYIKLFALLYADDTILFAENPNDLQHLLNVFYDYCENGD